MHLLIKFLKHLNTEIKMLNKCCIKYYTFGAKTHAVAPLLQLIINMTAM